METTIRRALYERFRLAWMLEHGYTLQDISSQLTSLWDELDPEDRAAATPETLFSEWEQDVGFGGSLWPCFGEFLTSEYLMPDYIWSEVCRFDPNLFRDYLNDLVALLKE